ncbi:MAG TPA: HAMP domain-containing sensor histidine kinase [Streptosporangiaceae bacterium]|jgi:signal transduction histidine kinase
MRRDGHPDGGKRSPLAGRAQRVHAARVAAVATLIIAVIYLAAMAIFNVVAGNRLAAQVDYQLGSTLREARQGNGFTAAALPDDADKDMGSPPILLWRVNASGRTLQSSLSAPLLPATAWPRSGQPATVRLGNATFRISALRTRNVWLVAAQSLEAVDHTQRQVLTAEAVAGPVLLVAIFLGTLMIGLKASGPVEHARRRQLEFTADASHELRTPLSVIEAETGLALSTPRDADQYRTTLQRVSRESKRLRRIVDNLLWLARFDSEPANPGHEPVDVFTIAEICADRFSAVAGSRGIGLTACSEGEPQALITAPPEWIDRLTGVLVDNACRYAAADDAGPRSPTVRIVVGCQGSKVSLTVEDSGPGIPEEERARLFGRFYRVTAEDGGSGLGLAIADAVVRSTGGRWRVDDSPLGGARMQVTWHRSGDRRNLRTLARGGAGER